MTKATIRLSAIMLASILAVTTFALYASLAHADRGNDRDRGDDGDTTEIKVENDDTRVSNDVSVTANTGGNDANGGDTGQGGNQPPRRGGLNLFGGQGGNGSGGDGGTITTGAATAYGTVMNDVNNNRVVVEGCGCDEGSRMDFLHRLFQKDDDGKNLEIEIENEDTKVRNELDVRANTGRNDANGGDARNGGSNNFNPWTLWFGHHPDNDAGAGGTIRTGGAYADGLITNVVNRNVVRVLNGDDEEDEDPV